MEMSHGNDTSMDSRLTELIRFFHAYVRGFRMGNAEERYHIELKHKHSLRVLREAAAIVSSLDMDPAERYAALSAALFHDMGRFPQYRTYKTFRDADSQNHALLGVRAVNQAGVLNGADPEHRKKVRTAVALHNRRSIPHDLPEKYARIVRIVRDADKLDILGIMIKRFRAEKNGSSTVTLHVQEDPHKFTDAVYRDVMEGRTADYHSMVWVNDFKLLVAGWVHDLNFRASAAAMLERGLLGEVFGTLPETPQFIDLQGALTQKLESMRREAP
jgi:HD superfamily phosphodiesterase